MLPKTQSPPDEIEIDLSRERVLADYRTAVESREASLIGRREVLTGKAKFGIFGDGKEVAQLAMARAFRPGDFRSGYYRDQTFMLARGIMTLEEFFAQLFADASIERDPMSGGRQMNGHFATRSLDSDGAWRDLSDRDNVSADVSPTGSQMPRLVGLAYASKLYREVPVLAEHKAFSDHGNEIAFGTIGDATCAEGLFWESVNAIGVLGAPALVSIWDDGYGISVPRDMQVTKGDLSALLSGFGRGEDGRGYDLYQVPGWDYPRLCEVYERAAARVRGQHVPAIIHVTEVTQPQGHSTSGSHERYKSAERLAWEEEFDPIRHMREWIIGSGTASAEELAQIEGEARERAREARLKAWEASRAPLDAVAGEVGELVAQLERESSSAEAVQAISRSLGRLQSPLRRDLAAATTELLIATREEDTPARRALLEWRREQQPLDEARYASELYSSSPRSALAVPVVEPAYADEPPMVRGFEVLNACFDAALERLPELAAFGEDVGHLGDVNQGLSGLQAKYGKLRVSDTGIREATIMGQAIGMAMRGLRPIAEIQYLDYILYGLQILSDDLATVRWRSCGGQMAPVIVRTRGHRLEGVWHAGSPMGAMIHLLRGLWVCVPRNMTQAAGMYNTLLHSDDPAVVVEVLNGYRLREALPENIAEMTVPLGVPEILRQGSDLSIVTYGACCRIVLDAAEMLAGCGVDVEVIDVQTLLPFDRPGRILESIRKTSRVLFVDEDVPGGASAYMMQEVVERQGAWDWLDAAPRTLSAKEHRPAYGSDGDYYSKPNRESVFEAAYEMMHEAEPKRYPIFFR